MLVAAGALRSRRRRAGARDRKWFPSPVDAPCVDAEGRPIAADPNAPVVARSHQDVDPSAEGQTLDRAHLLRHGQIRRDADEPLEGTAKKSASAASTGCRARNKKPIAEAGPGTIVAFARLDAVATGDTLTSNAHKVLLARRAGRRAGLRRRDQTEGTDRRSEDLADARAHRRRRSGAALARADVTHELLLLGRGEQHVSIAVERLARKYNVEVETRRADDPVPRNDHGRHRNTLALQASDRRPRAVRRRLAALRAARTRRRRHVRREDRRRRRAAPVLSRPSKRACAKRLPTAPSGYPGHRPARHALRRRSITTSTRASSRSRPPPGWACATRCRSAVRSCSNRSPPSSVIVPTNYTSTVIQQLTGKRGQILGMNPAEQDRCSTSSRRTFRKSSWPATSPSCVPRRKDSARIAGVTNGTIRFPGIRRLPKPRSRLRGAIHGFEDARRSRPLAPARTLGGMQSDRRAGKRRPAFVDAGRGCCASRFRAT